MNCRTSLWVFVTIAFGVTTLADSAEAQARVTFNMPTINIGSSGGTATSNTSTVQRGQYLRITLSGGSAPWSLFSNNATVKVEREGSTTFKVVPQGIGTSTLMAVEGTGGYKTFEVRVIDDRYGAAATIYDNSNGATINRNPQTPTKFSYPTGFRLTYMRTYHPSATIAGQLGLRHSDGRVFGPWMATLEGPFWVIRPNAAIPPGELTVIDSDPASWAWNSQSGGGFATLSGEPRLPNP